jgi:hypothetical protein
MFIHLLIINSATTHYWLIMLTKLTIKDLTDPFVNTKIININTKLPKGKEDKVTTESQSNTPPKKKKVRNEKAEDCTLLKWFFVCRDFRILKDHDIFAV